jgi:hypothetical protein
VFTYTVSGSQSVRFVLSEAGGAVAGTTYEYGALKAVAEQTDVAKNKAEVAQLEKRVAELKEKSLAANHPDVVAASRDLDLARLRLSLAVAAASRAEAAAASAESRGARPADVAQPRLIGSGRPLIDTTFNMAIGETVVVGTSRLQGDKALIVLLTAVK